MEMAPSQGPLMRKYKCRAELRCSMVAASLISRTGLGTRRRGRWARCELKQASQGRQVPKTPTAGSKGPAPVIPARSSSATPVPFWLSHLCQVRKGGNQGDAAARLRPNECLLSQALPLTSMPANRACLACRSASPHRNSIWAGTLIHDSISRAKKAVRTPLHPCYPS